MMPCVSQILGKNKTFPLNQKLTCANHGIYVATCVICHEQYAGQTKNKFSMRWSSHRSNWNRPNCEFDENNKDKVALLRHFSEPHGDKSKPPIHEACTVTFVEEPNSPSFYFTDLTHKLIFKTWSSHAWDNRFVSLPLNADELHFNRPFCFAFRGQCAGVFVRVSFCIVPAETWLP